MGKSYNLTPRTVLLSPRKDEAISRDPNSKTNSEETSAESGETSGAHSTSTTDKTDCQGLYDAVLNSELNGNEEEGSIAASGGCKDEALAELVKEYKTDDVVGTQLQNEQ